jgi:hypothetical protein
MNVSIARIFPLAILAAALLVAPALAGNPNVLTASEKAAGFELLFDGKGFEGWQHTGNWVARNGTMFRDGKGGGISYAAKPIPDDFELRFEWKVGQKSNSGVYYRPTQYEYQILDNKLHADGKNPRTSAASLYFCMAPSRDATKPVGQWNTGGVICKGTVIQHWLNGEKVIGFDYADPKYAEEVELLRLRGGNLTARGAHLSIQDHGDPVWFRGIKLRTLGKNDKIDRTPITPETIAKDVLEAEQKKLKMILQRRKAGAKKKAANK